ncbi:MAG: DNA replication/repair protein RecF [Alphaproteobacteria bacterium HGW-Alphaproteobacteria-2]|nr:MAG: DNA replication/repair protein RecF [Alphaproteobacteria bacterium HGW-Alphaproteobacteria-2]
MTGLRLTEITLSHFRSHHALRLAAGGRSAAFHGPNGAGKTNILEAISLLSPGRGLRRAALEELARQPEALGWKIRAILDGPGGAHEVETWAEPGSPRGVRIDGKPARQADLARLCPVLWLVPAMDRLWTEGAEGRRRFLDRMTMSLHPDHAEAVLTYEKAMRERNRLLRDQVVDGRWYGALERQMAETGAALTANRRAALARIAAAQPGADGPFPAAHLALAETGPETASDLVVALAAGRGQDLRAGRTLTGPHRTDLEAIYAAKGVAARRCSTGEQKALLVSLVLANARALAGAGAPPILLLDEVAAHLDNARRAALYDAVAALGAQAFMTGTEPGLFDGMGAGAQLWEVTMEAGLSVLHRAE